jgi:DNA-binding IclR family transcriptional regulator
MSTVDKALKIVELLENREDMGITAISRSLRLAPSTAHRLVASLAAHDFVVQDPETKRYRLGMRVFQLGSNVAARFGVRSAALRNMEVLVEETQETVNLGVLVRHELFYLEKIMHNDPIRVELQIGHAVPAHCTGLGKAILAYLPDNRLDALLPRLSLERRTSRSITNLPALRKELARIRRQGYAFDNSELIEGISCVAAPILTAGDIAIAAISVAGPSTRMSPGNIDRIIPLVKKAAEKTSREIQVLGVTTIRL